jgi:type I restriction enzyme S subunit
MSWKKVKLGKFLKVRDNRFKPNDVTIANLKRIDKIDFSGEIFISDKPSNTDMILIKKGDLVISGINVEKGAMAVYTGEEDITATIHYSSYSFDESEIDIEFLKFFLKSIEFKNALKEQVPGGIKTEIKPKHLLPLVVEIPTEISDQKEVVAILKMRNSKVEAISSELTHQLTLVKKLRQQLLQDAVEGKLVEQNKSRKLSGETGSELLKKIKAEKAKLIAEGKLKKEKPLPPIKPEEIPFEIPENWVWCRLGEILELISGQDLVPSEYNENKESGIPYITGASNLEKGEVILNRWTSKPRAFALKGDLLLTCKGSGVGKIAIFNEKEAHIARQIMSIRSKWLPIEFIRIFLELQTENFRKQAKSLIPGIDRGTVLTLIFPLPPSAEQNRIIQMVSELMKFCDQLEASIKESQEQNEKLLQQVLREALRK